MINKISNKIYKIEIIWKVWFKNNNKILDQKIKNKIKFLKNLTINNS
jgi:hypothetical protein